MHRAVESFREKAISHSRDPVIYQRIRDIAFSGVVKFTETAKLFAILHAARRPVG